MIILTKIAGYALVAFSNSKINALKGANAPKALM
jgi:hypothetical protein